MSAILHSYTPRPPKQASVLSRAGFVEVHHPYAVAPQSLPMLRFYAYPSEAAHGVGGVPLGLVYDACVAIAENTRGSLHLANGQRDLVANENSTDGMFESLLVPGRYIFIVESFENNYRICRSFREWVPPTGIPDRWFAGLPAVPPLAAHPLVSVSEVSAAVRGADHGCIVTDAKSSVQGAHVVPNSENGWWQQHRLQLESLGGKFDDLTSPRNVVSLRYDLNAQGIDRGLFVFVPHGEELVAAVIHDAPDFAHEFNLRLVRFPTRIPRIYPFIRLIYNVFMSSAFWIEETFKVLNTPKTNRSRQKQHEGEEEEEDIDAADPSDSEPGPSGAGDPSGGNSGDKKRRRTDDEDHDNNSSGSTRATLRSKHGGVRAGSHGRRANNGGRRKDDGDIPRDRKDDVRRDGQLSACEENLLSIFRNQDAMIVARGGSLTCADQQLGRYQGFPRYRRAAMEYRHAHPEVVAMSNPAACVWEGDAELEELRGWESS